MFTGFICLVIGVIIGVLINNSSRVPSRPSQVIIDEFKRSAEFSRMMDEYADYKISDAKRTGILDSAVVTKESFVNINTSGVKITEKTNRPEFDFTGVQFYDDSVGAFSREEITKFKDNKIPSEWLRPLKEPISTNKFTGKKVVITGVFSFDRIALVELLWKSGADLDTAINAKTDYVIKGENAGWRKCEQIEELGIACISEDEVLEDFPEL